MKKQSRIGTFETNARRRSICLIGGLLAVAAYYGCRAFASEAAGFARGQDRSFAARREVPGNTPAELSARWWQWAMREPQANNPLLDETGAQADRRQSGTVWFLPGTMNLVEEEPGFYRGAADRVVAVPPGKVLFFPIIASLKDNAGRSELLSTTALRALAQAEIDRVVHVSCFIDGQPVAGLENLKTTEYRLKSPVFSYYLPAEPNLRSLMGATTSGWQSPAVTEGLFLRLKPLPPGDHRIIVTADRVATDGFPDLSLAVTNRIRVGPRPAIVSPGTRPYGRTYGEWSALHWKWVYENPVLNHPLFDASGVHAAVGQSGPVWFLGGAYLYEKENDRLVATAQREVFVPAGKALFFPILDGEADNVGCPQAILGTDELRQAAADLIKTATNINCRVDGWRVAGLENTTASQYRTRSSPFGVQLPQDNVFAWSGVTNCAGELIPAGLQSPLLSDGLFLMLKPLPQGKHTIDFSGDVVDASGTPYFSLDIRYTNYVYDPPKVSAPDSNPFGKSYAEWSKLWWQWALQAPTTNHALFDNTGAKAGAGQTGTVWFLGGTYILIEDPPGRNLGVAVRKIQVPAGTAFFFPILNNETDNVGMDPLLNEQQLTDWARDLQNKATNMVCTIDGWPVPGLTNGLTTPYRTQTPVFGYTLPDYYNIYQYFGVDVKGYQYPAAADGVFLFVEPLEPGEHTIHFTGDIMGDLGTPTFSLNIRYDIKVLPPK